MLKVASLLVLGRAIVGVLLREVFDALIVGVEGYAGLKSFLPDAVEVDVTTKLLADENVGVSAVAVANDLHRFLAGAIHAVPVQLLYPLKRVDLEVGIAVLGIRAVRFFELLLLLGIQRGKVMIERAIVLQHYVHVAIRPYVRVVPIRALQVHFHLADGIRRV